jgi:hypothetical protein
LPARIALLCLGSFVESERFMRIAAAIVFSLISAMPAAASPSVEELFREFDLFGHWAADCGGAATPANPHVAVLIASPGAVVEEHNLGTGFALNRYSVLTAARVSETRLATEVIFTPSAGGEERQKLVIQVRNGTRRTMFNQPEGGAVRVKDGVAVAHGIKTPVLKKCGEGSR